MRLGAPLLLCWWNDRACFTLLNSDLLGSVRTAFFSFDPADPDMIDGLHQISLPCAERLKGCLGRSLSTAVTKPRYEPVHGAGLYSMTHLDFFGFVRGCGLSTHLATSAMRFELAKASA